MTIHRNLAIRPNVPPTVMLHSIVPQQGKAGQFIVTGWCMNPKVDDLLHLDMEVYKVLKITEQRDHKGVFDPKAFYIPGSYAPKKNPDDPNEKKKKTSEGEWRYKETAQNKNSFFKAVVEYAQLPKEDEFYTEPTPEIKN